jgi:RimJ/RimL family protein N-acetyltransferase
VFAKGWDEETDFNYGLFINCEVVGGCGLHRRCGQKALEIGYWIRAGYTGRGLASAAVRKLCDAAFRLEDVDRVEIHHDKANTVSGRIPAALGFVLVGESVDVIAVPGEIGIDCGWRLDKPRE